MKNIFKSMMLIAAAAMTFAACQPNEIETVDTTGTHTVKFAVSSDFTKTTMTEGETAATFAWEEYDMAHFHIFENGVEGLAEGKIDSETGAVSLEVAFADPSVTPSEYVYTGFMAATTTEVAGQLYPAISPDQAYTDTYDRDFDILIAKPVTASAAKDEFAGETALQFKRVVAVNKATIKGLAAGEHLESATFTAAEGGLTGYYDFVADKWVADDNKVLNVVCDQDVATDGTAPIYFLSAPVADANLSIDVITSGTDEDGFWTAAYNKTFGKTITLMANMLNRFSVNLEGCEVVEPVKAWTLVTDASTLADGDKVVIAAAEYNYAISTTQNSNNRGQAIISKAEDIITSFADDVQVFTLESVTDGKWAFATENGYIYAASSSSNYLKTQNTNNANGEWSIAIIDNITSIVAQGNYTRNVLQYNLTSGLFSCYGSASQKAVVLYKYAEHAPIAKALATITLNTEECKTEYVVGETFTAEGLVVTANYTDGTHSIVEPTSISTPDMTTSGKKTITVSYVEDSINVEATYDISVIEPGLASISDIKSTITSTDRNKQDSFEATLTDAVVSYVSGKYAFIEDAGAGIVYYASSDITNISAGDVINGSVSGRGYVYNAMKEITSLDISKATITTTTSIPEHVLTPTELIANFDRYYGCRVKMVDVEVAVSTDSKTIGGIKAYTYNSVTLYNGTATVICFPSYFNDPQVLVFEAPEYPAAAVTGVTLNQSSLSLVVGAASTLVATVAPGNATNKNVSWSSSNTGVATVVNGVVTAVAVGNATITVTTEDGGYKANCSVTVTAKSEITSVSIEAGTNGSKCIVNDKDGIKIGTSKAGGDCTITVPAGSNTLCFHAAAWKGVTDLSLDITGASSNPTSISLNADTGISNNSPFTLDGVEDDYYFEIKLSNITNPTIITLTSSAKRCVVWDAFVK